MAFTALQLQNIANALLDYNVRGPAMSQVLQDRPFLNDLLAGQKEFPGGKDKITWNVKGVYSTAIQGYDHDDTVTYGNPANIKQASTKWYELHAGIETTLTELKKAGISVVDSMTGKETVNHSEQEKVEITNLLQDKIEDMTEGWARSFTEMVWRDGTLNAKHIPGVRSFVLDNPAAAGTTFGIDRVANSWWRNHTDLLINVGTPANLNLITALQNGLRAQRRFGGRPNKAYCGSTFLEALEAELRSKGQFTQTGFNNKGATEIGVADVSLKGVVFQYDPVMDDLGLDKYCGLFDMSKICLRTMSGEDRKMHNPARPADQYVMYRAMTYTGGLTCSQLNAQGIYSIA
jgi:hypothetical protein